MLAVFFLRHDTVWIFVRHGMECKTESNAFNVVRAHGAYPGMWQCEFDLTKEPQGTGLQDVCRREGRKWLTTLSPGPCGPFGHPIDSSSVVDIPKEATDNQH